jgi:hypothetical protein
MLRHQGFSGHNKPKDSDETAIVSLALNYREGTLPGYKSDSQLDQLKPGFVRFLLGYF